MAGRGGGSGDARSAGRFEVSEVVANGGLGVGLGGGVGGGRSGREVYDFINHSVESPVLSCSA